MLSINRSKTHNKTQNMNTQNAVLELVKLLSQAIDMIRDYNGQDDADYLDKEMQTIIDEIKK